jgi:serine/threonine protein kinase
MATVHRAYDHCAGRDVAVKVFRPGTEIADADERRRREVGFLSALDDPGLVAVLDADLGDATTPSYAPYLVTELVDGPTLAQRIRTAPLSAEQVIRLGCALCRTLAYIHDRGIVHRDVKPANILIGGTSDADLSTPKLADFGIAVAVDGTRFTTEGITVGTANYLSPEQVRGEPVTPASDIYSLGLVLIEGLTGALTFPGTGIEAALARLHRPPEIPVNAGRGLGAVLEQMTACDPRDRCDARQAAAHLEELATDAHSLSSQILRLGEPVAERARPRSSQPSRSSRSSRHRLRRRTRLGAAGLLLASCLALAATIAVAAFTTEGRPPAPVNQAPEPGAVPAATVSRSPDAGTSPPPVRRAATVPPLARSTPISALDNSASGKGGPGKSQNDHGHQGNRGNNGNAKGRPRH